MRKTCAFLFTLATMFPLPLVSQDSSRALQANLLNHPLYLRGLWSADKLSFDSTGSILGEFRPGSLTLSGIDVRNVAVHGNLLSIHGERVALVANSDGRLERRKIENVTLMFGTFQKKFVAHEDVNLTIQADSAGSFDHALKIVLADGLEDLATSVPVYWKCYAAGYFAHKLEIVEAEKVVANCVKARNLTGADLVGEGDDVTPLRVIGTVPPQYTPVAAAMGVDGSSKVHVTVTEDGSPVGFQIVHAIGAGLDEQSLAVIFKYTFQAATKNSKPVRSDFDVSIKYQLVR